MWLYCPVLIDWTSEGCQPEANIHSAGMEIGLFFFLAPSKNLLKIPLVLDFAFCDLHGSSGVQFVSQNLIFYLQFLQSRHHTIPHHTVPHHSIPYNTITHHTTPHHPVLSFISSFCIAHTCLIARQDSTEGPIFLFYAHTQ